MGKHSDQDTADRRNQPPPGHKASKKWTADDVKAERKAREELSKSFQPRK